MPATQSVSVGLGDTILDVVLDLVAGFVLAMLLVLDFTLTLELLLNLVMLEVLLETELRELVLLVNPDEALELAGIEPDSRSAFHSQSPVWQVVLPQKSAPVPHLPSRLQQLPHLPAHRLLPWSIPHVPSVLHTLSPGQ